jgi:hypothetical protein
MITMRDLQGSVSQYDYFSITHTTEGKWTLNGCIRSTKRGVQDRTEELAYYATHKQAHRVASILTTAKSWKCTHGEFTIDQPRPTTIAQHLAILRETD